ncbi:unnamed protein product [Arctia plantaginis]|nr:unnamed protein product [Arctia plantaginis]
MGKVKPRKQEEAISTGEIVLSAIKKLMKNTGWTARTIIKFIKLEYRISDSKISQRVSRALKRGVRLGILQMERGRYRLNNMASLARQVSPTDIRSNQCKLQQELSLRIRSGAPSVASRLNKYSSRRKYKR